MKIAIIGGGSLGLLFAHHLNKHHQVCIYVRSMEQKTLLASEGLVLQNDDERIVYPIYSALFSEWRGMEDLTIIAVKQYHLPNILKGIEAAAPGYSGSFLFLQNGMGHLKLLNQLNGTQVYVGAVEHGAAKADNNEVIHTGNGVTKVALYKGNQQSFIKEMKNLHSECFPILLEKSYEDMLEKKLIVNAVINPLTAILKITNGELLENPHYYTLFKKVFKEISVVLLRDNHHETFAYVKNVCRNTAANRSSMLQDLDGGRHTEVDAILGYILEKANELGVRSPLIEFFYHSIKGKED